MQPEEVEDGIFSSPLDLEEERRKYEASTILYRAIKYIIGYLKGYKIEKQENLISNPMWILVKVWWKTEDIKKDIEQIEAEIKEMVRKRDEELQKEANEYQFKDYKEEIQIGD